MFTWRPTPRLSLRSLAILRQYCRFANRRDHFGVDLLERSDPWERIPIGYFIDFADPDHLSISRALMPFCWSWLSWGNQICEDWHVLKCQKEDTLALLWSGVQSSFRESRFEIVPDRRERQNGSATHLMTAHLTTELQRTRRCGSCLRRELHRVGDTGHNEMTFLPDSEPVC